MKDRNNGLCGGGGGSCRWMLVGAYVGFATVGVFCAWYLCDSFLGINLSADGHTTVTWQQLRAWESCAAWSPAFQARGSTPAFSGSSAA